MQPCMIGTSSSSLSQQLALLVGMDSWRPYGRSSTGRSGAAQARRHRGSDWSQYVTFYSCGRTRTVKQQISDDLADLPTCALKL